MKGGESTFQGWRLAAVVLAALALIWSPVPAPAATNQAAELAGDEAAATTEKGPVDVAAITAAVKVIKENGAVRIVPEHRLLYDNGPLVNSPGTGEGGAITCQDVINARQALLDEAPGA